MQESTDFSQVVPTEEIKANVQVPRTNHAGNGHLHRRRGGIESRTSLKKSYDTISEASQASQTTQDSRGSSVRSVPVEITASTGFAWAKKQKQPDVFTRLHNQTTSRIKKSSSLDPSLQARDTYSDGQENDDSSGMVHGVAAPKRAMRSRNHKPESFDSSDIYVPQELSEEYDNEKKDRIGFSGPLRHSQEIASRQHGQTHQVLHRSRFYKDF